MKKHISSSSLKVRKIIKSKKNQKQLKNN